MYRNKSLRGVAMLCLSAILWISCKKEDQPLNPVTDVVNNSAQRASGVVPDDPTQVAKLPIIASADYLANKIPDYFAYQSQSQSLKGAGGGRDRTSPAVNINSPVSGSTVSNTVSVNVSATDNVAVTSVVLQVDGSTIGTSSTAPYTFNWNTSGIGNGTHSLSATAYDAAGNSKTHTIQVGYNTASGADITPPSVTITSPVNGAAVTSTIVVSASASDNIGVSTVTFQVDGATIATDNSAPYSFSWNTATVAAGIHTLGAVAKDAAGNSNSASIQVTVNTTVIPPGTLPSSYHLLMPPVGDQAGEFACVSFAAGYAARSVEQFYSTNATSYNFSSNVFSPEFLYNQTKAFSYCSSGSGIVTALEFMKSTGICTWQTMPYSGLNGCALMPTSSQTLEANNFKIATYSVVSKTDVTAMKTMIVNKHPLILTVNLDDSFTNAQPGFTWSAYSGTVGFSHALVICGYDDSRNAFKVMNSWGTGWGDSGYSWIDYSFLSQTGGQWVFVINA